MKFTPEDARHMAHALRLARRGLYTTDPNPRVGCVIVNDGRVIAEGWHERAGEPHAEINALRSAGDRPVAGASVYLTLEPCCHHGRTPPCTQALIEAGVGRVVVAMPDPNPQVAGEGIALLKKAGIAVDVGLMQAEAEALNPGFISRMTRDRPLVRVKLASSLDGRTALAHGESKWITGEAARADVQKWRARSSAILTGVGTVLMDDPSLTVRDYRIGRQPLRVVLDNNLSMPPTAKMLALEGKTLVVTCCSDEGQAGALRDAGAEVLLLPGDPRIELAALMQELASREVNELHVEAGATVCGALLEAGLVDELLLYVAPHVMGDKARGMFKLPALESMTERVALAITDVRAVGRDWRVSCKIAGSGRPGDG